MKFVNVISVLFKELWRGEPAETELLSYLILFISLKFLKFCLSFGVWVLMSL